MEQNSQDQCAQDLLTAAIDLTARDEAGGLQMIADIILAHPKDARLHFLRGSILASSGQFPAAQAAMSRALEIAPSFLVARFQLGFLQLTSAEPGPAAKTWEPLLSLSQDHPLRLFVVGLDHMVADAFDQSREAIEKGIALNSENPAINGDMTLILDAIHKLQFPDQGPDEPTSSAHFLLQDYAARQTKH